MGVNWQNNEYYRTLINEERNTGFSVADRNRIANPYGNHSFGGLLISQVLPQLLMGGAEKLGAKLEGSSDTGSATNVKASTEEKININKILRKFDRAVKKGDKKEIETHYNTIKKLSTDNSENTQYKRILEHATLKKENSGKRV